MSAMPASGSWGALTPGFGAGLGALPCWTTGRVKAATRGSDRSESQVRACMKTVYGQTGHLLPAILVPTISSSFEIHGGLGQLIGGLENFEIGPVHEVEAHALHCLH